MKKIIQDLKNKINFCDSAIIAEDLLEGLYLHSSKDNRLETYHLPKEVVKRVMNTIKDYRQEYQKKLDALTEQSEMFAGAKFGDIFVRRDGGKAIYHSKRNGLHTLMSEECDSVMSYLDNGRRYMLRECSFDIISKV